MTPPPFDSQHFTALVRAFAQEAFQDILNSIEGEQLYVFGLYTNGEGTYVLPTSNTEEALDRKALTYAEEGSALFDLERQALRWSPCDWEYHQKGGDATGALVGGYLETGWDSSYTEFSFDADLIDACYIEALQQLQREHLLSAPGYHKPILINLFKGDQSDEERIAFAKQLNDDELCAQFQQELDQGYEAFYALLNASRQGQ
ncbi:MAG TPA: DUF4303 domain-containing protein [Roseiflexaceae bacterium]|nr:DUF4303 domain-containing protein [Roseiflexaceae bacterium]